MRGFKLKLHYLSTIPLSTFSCNYRSLSSAPYPGIKIMEFIIKSEASRELTCWTGVGTPLASSSNCRTKGSCPLRLFRFLLFHGRTGQILSQNPTPFLSRHIHLNLIVLSLFFHSSFLPGIFCSAPRDRRKPQWQISLDQKQLLLGDHLRSLVWSPVYGNLLDAMIRMLISLSRRKPWIRCKHSNSYKQFH